PVPTAAAVYEQVRQRAPGTPIEYSFRSPEGHSLVAMVHARRFSTADYVLIFGAYLLNGVAFLGTGLLVAYLKPRNAASLGLLAARAAPGERGRARYARRLPDPRRADGGLRLLRRQGAAQRRRLHGVPLPREPRVRDRQAGPLRDRRHAPPRDHVRGRGGGHRQPLLGAPLGGCLLPAHSQPGGAVAARAGDPQPGAALPDRARARPRAGRRRPPLLPQSVRRGAGPLRAEPCPRLGAHPRRGG